MSALGSMFWRIVVDNRSGSALAASGSTVTIRGFSYNSSGALVDSGTETSLSIPGSLANNTSTILATQNNGTNKFVGAAFMMKIASSAGCTGSVFAYLQVCTGDGQGDWPTTTSGAVRGRPIMSVTDVSSAAKIDDAVIY